MTEARFAIAIASMLLLALGVVVFVLLYQRRAIRYHFELQAMEARRQKDLLQASIQAQESERKRIAEELHDDVGATLSSIRLFLHKKNGDTQNDFASTQVKSLLDESIGKVRSLSHQLQPGLLHRLGLGPALRAYADMLNSSGQLSVQCRELNTLPALSDETQLSVYRIVQELVTNALKHSSPTAMEFTVGMKNEQSWYVSVSHDGSGLTQEAFDAQLSKPGAIGLKNILTRVQVMGASLSFSEKNGVYQTEIVGKNAD